MLKQGTDSRSDPLSSLLLGTARSDASEHVKMEVWHAPGRSKPFFKEAIRKHYKPLRKGEQFGPSWTNHWVRMQPSQSAVSRAIC